MWMRFNAGDDLKFTTFTVIPADPYMHWETLMCLCNGTMDFVT